MLHQEMSNQDKISLHIHCRNLPRAQFEGRTGVRLGVQKGQEVVEDVPGDAAEVSFMVPLRVMKNPRDGTPNFLGPFAHGTPAKRFIYLCWGQRRGEAWEGFRRAKIHLSQIPWDVVQQALAKHQPLGVSIDMTDDKGGPLCGLVGAGKIEWKV